jgi:hypothetical protein
MKHPYTALEQHPLWEVIKTGLEDHLVANRDLTITTSESHVIGYLLAKIVEETDGAGD